MACTYYFLYRHRISDEICKHGRICHKLHIDDPTGQTVQLSVEDDIQLVGKVIHFDKYEAAIKVAVRSKKNAGANEFHDLRFEHIRTIYANENFTFAICERE